MPTDNLNLWGTLMSDKYEGLRRAAEELVTAMETCHECKGLLVLQEDPAHCEDCSYDCESHEGPDMHSYLRPSCKAKVPPSRA